MQVKRYTHVRRLHAWRWTFKLHRHDEWRVAVFDIEEFPNLFGEVTTPLTARHAALFTLAMLNLEPEQRSNRE